ncbi:DNA polymerase [Thermogemmatispora onikobensis]|uniref:DNA polymerase n=1 Tax=Thermogemmatispora onikobensis TaxID=732234 RepID=UPI000852DD4D|nr:DNA polymerase [Thermogemmatispora onikobensis]
MSASPATFVRSTFMRSLAEIDLVHLIQQETGLQFSHPVGKDRVAKGPCPWCGGRDRFGIVTATQPQRFYCGWHGQGCLRHGDALTFLALWKGWSRAEARAWLGCWEEERGLLAAAGAASQGSVAADAPPPQQWQEAGRALLEQAQRWLWTEQGAVARAYLARRGLREETVRRLGWGYLPAGVPLGQLARPETWGLTDREPDRPLRLPVGLVIPWESAGALWKLVFRRVEQGQVEHRRVASARAGRSWRYWTLPGSRPCLYRLDRLQAGQPVVLVEGEIDVATLEQEVGELVVCVGTGGAAGARSPTWVERLHQAACVLVAFDQDPQGQGAIAARYWLEALGARAWLWQPISKDVNEMLQAGQDLRAWVQAGLVLAQAATALPAASELQPSEQEPEQDHLTRATRAPEDMPALAADEERSGSPVDSMPPPLPEEEGCQCCGKPAHWVDPDDRPCCEEHVLPWDLTPLVSRGLFERLRSAAWTWEHLVRAVAPSAAPEGADGHGQPATSLPEQESSAEDAEQLEYTALLLYELVLRIRSGSAWVGLDCETTGLSPRRDRLITVTFGQPGLVFLLDLRLFWTIPAEEQARWKREIQALFALLGQAAAEAQTVLTWVGHHLKFDWQFLAQQLGVFLVPPGPSVSTRLYDTMLVEQVLRNGDDCSWSLEATAQRYGVAVSKVERPWFVGLDHRMAWQESLPEPQLRYLVQDVLVPLAIAAQQQERIRRVGVERIVQLEHDALPIVAEMERHGVLIDQVSWQRLARRQQERLERIEADLTATLGTIWAEWKERQEPLRQLHLLEGSAASPAAVRFSLHILQQVREALEVVCGAPLSGLSEEALAPFADRAEVQAYLEWRKLQHWCTTFGESFLRYVEEDGRIHADFRQVGARSGRIICQTPNLQQIPRRSVGEPGDAGPEEEDEILVAGALRRCFVAPPGAKLLTVDLANIELRILAECAHDERMLTAFAAGKDLHSETARLVFGLPEEADPRRERWGMLSMREVAKAVNFGLLYGMGPASLARRIGVSLEEARLLMERFFAAYPRVSSWLQRASRQALRRGEARTLGGRVRWFKRQQAGAEPPGLLERAARNHPIQGTNADILKQALALLWQRLPVEVHVVLVVHDELVLECPNERVEEAICMLQQSLMDACREWLPTVALPEPEVCCAPWWRK